MFSFRSKLAAIAAAGIIGASVLGAGAAEAAEPASAEETVALHFDGFDVARAADNGFDVRTDSSGWQYAVPTGTPLGSTAGAQFKYNPESGAVKPIATNPGGVHTYNTVVGNCGSATLTLYTRTSGYTGYNLNGTYGPALKHTWRITVKAATGKQVVNKDGLPPIPGGSLNWGTNFSYNVHASGGAAVSARVTTARVTTVLGSCTGLAPGDNI